MIDEVRAWTLIWMIKQGEGVKPLESSQRSRGFVDVLVSELGIDLGEAVYRCQIIASWVYLGAVRR